MRISCPVKKCNVTQKCPVKRYMSKIVHFSGSRNRPRHDRLREGHHHHRDEQRH